MLSISRCWRHADVLWPRTTKELREKNQRYDNRNYKRTEGKNSKWENYKRTTYNKLQRHDKMFLTIKDPIFNSHDRNKSSEIILGPTKMEGKI